jgi:DNA polymerase III epsilon subunit-like protein
MQYSAEQEFIITQCLENRNVIVDAVAGSGKTTTLLGIAKANPDKKMLGVLFNRSLKEETRTRAQNLGLHCLEIHNYHAVARKYYDETICNDNGITKLVRENKHPLKALPKWERIIIDEVQDMNPLYFQLIRKLLIDIRNPDIRITVMGDRFQSIYAFLYADSRFLTNAGSIYKSVKGDWIKATLSTTYRCSPSICSFLNDCLLGYKRLHPAATATAPTASASASAPVNYIYGCPFEARKPLLTAILHYLSNGFKPEDIFILAPSVKMKMKETPVKMLENALVAQNIPIYIPNNDEQAGPVGQSGGQSGQSGQSDDPTKGKLVITTFHQSKGLERAIVIIYNFDSSYFKIFNKDADPNALTAELYVAITRAAKHLYVIQDKRKLAFSFLKEPQGSYVRFITSKGQPLSRLPSEEDKEEYEHKKPRIFHASEITNYLTADVILDAVSYLTVKTVQEPYCKIDLQSIVQTKPGHCEVVCDINGTAIPAVYEWQKRKTMRIANIDDDTLMKDGPKFAQRYKELQRTITNSTIPQISDVLEISNLFTSITEGYHYKVNQIKDYNWLQNADIEPCMEILELHLDADDMQYEVALPEQTTPTYTVLGRIDAYSESQSTLWEIKCTDKFDHTHEIQLAIYAWMFSRQFPTRFYDIKFNLLNIRTGECRNVSASIQNLEEMMSFLIAEKMRVFTKMTDEEFNTKFAVKFDLTQPQNFFKQQTINAMITGTKQPALFIDDEDDKPVKKAKAVAETNAIEPPPEEKKTTQKKQSQQTLPFAPKPNADVKEQEQELSVDLEVKPTALGKVLVYDLETNGLPDCPSFGTYYSPEELHRYKSSRIVQWSWSLHEPDGTLIVEEDHIIKPNLAEYRILNDRFHGITENIARIRGISFEQILETWKDHLSQVTTIVGHNVNFDKHVLLSELHRRGYPEVAKAMMEKKWICTMERATKLCNLKARNKLKPPKLCELMHALNVKEEVGRAFHNSKHDVYYTARCFFAEQVLINPCPKMYDGQHAGKTYEEIYKIDRPYAVQAAAACNVHKLYDSPIRKLSNWVNDKAKADPVLRLEIIDKEALIKASIK